MAHERDSPASPVARWLAALAVSLVVAGGGHVGAHDVAPDPVVDLTVRTSGTALSISATVPVIALAGAGIRVDGTEVPAPSTASLDLVSRDLAANLELAQGDRPLPAQSVSATLDANRTAVVVALAYAIEAGGEPVTARLPPYGLGGVPIKTVVHVVNPADEPRVFVVNGAAERVAFAPSLAHVLRRFASRAAKGLTSSAQFLCFALCLIVPGRKPGALMRSARALLAAECVALVLWGAAVLPAAPLVVSVASLLAASTIVVAALLTIASVGSRWITALATLFGLVHGVTVGAALAGDAGFAGAHVAAALIAFAGVTAVGQVWIVALLASAVGLLIHWRLPQRVAVTGLAALAAHTGAHGVMDETPAVASSAGVSSDHLGVAIVLAWSVAILCAGIAERVWHPDGSAGPLVPSDEAVSSPAS